MMINLLQWFLSQLYPQHGNGKSTIRLLIVPAFLTSMASSGTSQAVFDDEGIFQLRMNIPYFTQPSAGVEVDALHSLCAWVLWFGLRCPGAPWV